jgi:hypothetical protein
MTQTDNARELFQAAYEHRYTWDENFPGYSAEITVKQGEEIHTGNIIIKPDMTVEISGIDDEKVKQSVANQLRDIVTHRKRSSFEKTHGKNSFSMGKIDDHGAMEILVKGDAMGSNYKIKNTEICQVSRVMGTMAFQIDTHASLETPEGYISRRYDAIFHNTETGNLMRELEFEDSYEKVGDYYLMTHQTINSKENDQVITTEFTYANMALLDRA